MNLDELKMQVQKDLRIDDEHLDTESLKNQEIKAMINKIIASKLGVKIGFDL